LIRQRKLRKRPREIVNAYNHVSAWSSRWLFSSLHLQWIWLRRLHRWWLNKKKKRSILGRVKKREPLEKLARFAMWHDANEPFFFFFYDAQYEMITCYMNTKLVESIA
jgi:hypothetical protein